MHSKLLSFLVLLGAPLLLQAAPVTLSVDKLASRVNVDVKATVDSFVGKLNDYKAEIAVDSETGAVLSCNFTFRVVDIKTGKDKRDKAMNEWQKSDKFADASFVMESIAPAAGNVQTVKGTCTFHGVSKPLSFPLTVTRKGTSYQFDGEAIIDTQEHDLPIIRMMAVLKVDPKVKVAFHVEAAQKP